MHGYQGENTNVRLEDEDRGRRTGHRSGLVTHHGDRGTTRGVDPDRHRRVQSARPRWGLWHTWQSTAGGAWSEWASLGGRLSSGPVVTQGTELAIMVEVFGPDGQWHTKWQQQPNCCWTDQWH